MAFIDFADVLAVPSAGTMRSRSSCCPEALSALETAAVGIGAQDGLSSLRQRGSLTRLLDAVFAVRPPNSLADATLEAVRRLSVAAHVGADHDLRSEAQNAIDVGVPAPKVAAVLTRFGRSFVNGVNGADAFVPRAL